MLKIGEFARLAQVTVKALRYYDSRGLLRPDHIDRFTGYRYYALEQLPRLNRILALKDLGFTLDQIDQILNEELPAAELRGMLRLRHAKLQQEVLAEQARLARVEARLKAIEHEGCLPTYPVVLKQLPAQHVLGIRQVLPAYGDTADLFRELRHIVRQADLAQDALGPYIGLYYEPMGSDQGVDVEVAILLAAADGYRRCAMVGRCSIVWRPPTPPRVWSIRATIRRWPTPIAA